MAKNKKLNYTAEKAVQKTEGGRPSAGGYVNANERLLYKRIKSIQGMVCSVLVVSVMAFCLSAITAIFYLSDYKVSTTKAAEWVECTLGPNNEIGYKVKSDWVTQNSNNVIAFTVADNHTITVATQSLVSINANSVEKCTEENLDNFIRKEIFKSLTENNITVQQAIYKTEPCKVMNTTVTAYYAAQQASYIEGEEHTVSNTYLVGIFFIYDNYLYTFTETKMYQGNMSEEYKTVLKSIREIDPSERYSYNFDDVILGSAELSDKVDEYVNDAVDRGIITTGTSVSITDEFTDIDKAQITTFDVANAVSTEIETTVPPDSTTSIE